MTANRLLAIGQRMKERTVTNALQDIANRVEWGQVPSALLRDAASLPPAVLALPRNYDRFMTLYSDFIA